MRPPNGMMGDSPNGMGGGGNGGMGPSMGNNQGNQGNMGGNKQSTQVTIPKDVRQATICLLIKELSYRHEAFFANWLV